VISVLEDAIDTLPTSEMLLQAFRFTEDYKNDLEHSEEEESNNDISQVDDFIQKLWAKARDVDSSDLAMEETRYLMRQSKPKEALQTIKQHCTRLKAAPSEAWLLWASLSGSLKKQTSILKHALQRIPIDKHPDYVTILLQYLATQLKTAKDDDNDDENKNKTGALFETLQNLILLAPKTAGDICVKDTGLDFELSGIFEGYKACLDHFYETKGIVGARSIYEAVLFRSSVKLSEETAEALKEFVDRCLELELNRKTTSVGPKHSQIQRRVLRKLYDKVIDIFEGTPLEESYRYDRNELAVYA